MLHYTDLPPLIGTEEEVKRARIVRFACLRTIQRTQRVLLQQVGMGKRSPQVYHRQTAALKITVAFYTSASWWITPFPSLEQQFRTTWGRIMAVPYRVVEGRPRFIFPEEEQDFAQLLAPLAPQLIYQEIPCVLCRQPMIRSALKSLWEPEWCGCCMPTDILLPHTDMDQRALVSV